MDDDYISRIARIVAHVERLEKVQQRKPMTEAEMLAVCVSGKVESPTPDEVALIRAVERHYGIGDES